MVLQHLLLSTELTQFQNMIASVKGGKSIDNIAQTGISYLFLYGTIVYLLYHFILERKGSLKEAFLLGCSIYIVSDFTVYAFFEASRPYLFTFIYDVLIAGGGCFVATTYLIKKYYNSIEKYTIGLFLLYILIVTSQFYQPIGFPNTY